MAHVLVRAETRERTCEAGETTANKCIFQCCLRKQFKNNIPVEDVSFEIPIKDKGMSKLRFEADGDVRLHVPVREAKQASVLLRARSRRRKSAFSSVKLCFLGHCYFCLRLFGRPVTDTEAAPPSETPGAGASVSDASLIRVGALISAFPPPSASPSVRSASEPTRRRHA